MWFELNHDHRADACGGTWRIGVLAGWVGTEDVKEICMRPRSPHCLSAALAVCVLLPAAARAQVIPFAGNFGQGLAPSDNQMVFESVARLNAVEPSKVGESNSWSNPETKSSGTSTILQGLPFGWHGLPPRAPSHCRRKAAASRLPPHLVPHADRRMEDQGLSSGRLAPPLFREGDGSVVARSDQGAGRSGRKLLRKNQETQRSPVD